MPDHPFRTPDIPPFPETCSVTLTAAGLKLGSKTLLVRFDAGSRRLAIAADFPRCSALLSVAARRAMPASLVGHLEAVASFWQRGDPALANLRLVFAGLPRLDSADDVARVRVAEHLLDAGYDPTELLKELGLDPAEGKLAKYDPNQPRVPAGQGDKSGEWTAFWDRIAGWLKAPVPVYDQDTGIEVGTQTRGRAIATNPVAVGAAGAAVLLGAEAVAGLTAEGVAVGTILPDGTVAGASPIGAAPNLTRLGKAFGINADSEIGANILNNIDMKVSDFISENRIAGILRIFPSEYLDVTIGRALKEGGSTVRKLLLDSRFKK